MRLRVENVHERHAVDILEALEIEQLDPALVGFRDDAFGD